MTGGRVCAQCDEEGGAWNRTNRTRLSACGPGSLGGRQGSTLDAVVTLVACLHFSTRQRSLLRFVQMLSRKSSQLRTHERRGICKQVLAEE